MGRLPAGRRNSAGGAGGRGFGGVPALVHPRQGPGRGPAPAMKDLKLYRSWGRRRDSVCPL
ncbi:hypothetical protein MTBUT4_470019 [Magnetospirillum sp. UT-4]|nr:hypothetical protein MTBUT4_470019 [Magnetospirillum sp. UT-4]